MPTTFEKLNVKSHNQIMVLNAPSSFEPELKSLAGVTILRSPDQVKTITFALVFATRKLQVDQVSPILVEKLHGDAILWFAYPKGTSKKYTCDFNRDNGWDVIQKAGFEPVRMVAIDQDWSALRFRRSEFIKK